MFSYTNEELDHLAALMECAFMARFDDSDFGPRYYRHLAACALDVPPPERPDRKLAGEMLERAEALECGMENGGETLP